MDRISTLSPEHLLLQNLYARYHAENILQNITGTIQSHTLTAVVGPNGGGKSTLLKVIMGFLSPYKGHLVNTFSSQAYLAQQCTVELSFPLTVFDIVSFGLWSRLGAFQALTPQLHEEIMDALEQVGMASYKSVSPNALSGGQLQRVFFARLCLQDAALILLDEPFTGIDQKTTLDLMTLILKWHQKGKTILAVLHDLELVRRFFPQCLILSKQLEGWGETKLLLDPRTHSDIPVCTHSKPQPI